MPAFGVGTAIVHFLSWNELKERGDAKSELATWKRLNRTRKENETSDLLTFANFPTKWNIFLLVLEVISKRLIQKKEDLLRRRFTVIFPWVKTGKIFKWTQMKNRLPSLHAKYISLLDFTLLYIRRFVLAHNKSLRIPFTLHFMLNGKESNF